jgi:hypothetical protein
MGKRRVWRLPSLERRVTIKDECEMLRGRCQTLMAMLPSDQREGPMGGIVALVQLASIAVTALDPATGMSADDREHTASQLLMMLRQTVSLVETQLAELGGETAE